MLNYHATTLEKLINKLLISVIEEDHGPYLLEVALKILINQDQDLDPLTPTKRTFWNSFSQWERSILLTGDPIGISEWRTNP